MSRGTLKANQVQPEPDLGPQSTDVHELMKQDMLFFNANVKDALILLLFLLFWIP